MKITLYFIGWNDAYYLPFIKKHYGQFCQRIVYYDNHSSDNSVELAESFGFEVRNFGTIGQLNDEDYLTVKNNCWKEERGKSDYVIVCDSDEFLVIDKLEGTLPVVKGYNMISDKLPVNEIFEANTGAANENYSKQVIFNPEHIEEINFVHGCHKNNAKGLLTTNGHCRLFHFRQIGGVQRLIDRHSDYRERMSAFNKRFNMGWHYNVSDDTRRNEWEVLMKEAKQLY